MQLVYMQMVYMQLVYMQMAYMQLVYMQMVYMQLACMSEREWHNTQLPQDPLRFRGYLLPQHHLV